MEVQTMSRSIISKSGYMRLCTGLVALLIVSATAMAQVEQHSQISLQGTALVTKDTNPDFGPSQHTTKSGGFLVGYSYQFNNWAGVEGNYGWSRNTQNYLGSFGGSSIRSDIHEVTGSFVF